jgi:hypothetical protein
MTSLDPRPFGGPASIPQVYGVFLLTGGDFQRIVLVCESGRDRTPLLRSFVRWGRGRGSSYSQHGDCADLGVSLRFTAEEDLLELADSLARLAYQEDAK